MSTLDDNTITFDQRLKELDEEKARIYEEKGYKEFYKFPQGETTFTIDTTHLPRKVEMNGQTKTVYRIIVDGTQFDYPFTSFIERAILENVKAGKTTLTLIRLGEGSATRYSLKD